MPDRDLRPTVLVVDDDRTTLLTYATALSAAGYAVYTATTLAEALQAVAAHRPDVIISDLRLGDEDDGLTFLRQLRAQDRGATPFGIVTGHYDLAGQLNAELQALGAEIRHKPLWIDDLLEFVAVLLRRTS